MTTVLDPAPLASAPTTEALLERIARLEAVVQAMSAQLPEDRAAILVMSGDMERVHTALMLAHASAALGLDATMYFAMWGIQALRSRALSNGKSTVGRCLSQVLASDVSRLPSSRMNFGGLGPRLFAKIMEDKSIPGAAELLELAPQCGIELVACPLSLDMFEIGQDELVEGVDLRGATSFIEEAQRARFACVL